MTLEVFLTRGPFDRTWYRAHSAKYHYSTFDEPNRVIMERFLLRLNISKLCKITKGFRID